MNLLKYKLLHSYTFHVDFILCVLPRFLCKKRKNGELLSQQMKLLFTILTFLVFSGLSHAAELKIGLIPEQNVFKQFERYRLIGEYVEKKSGIKITFSLLSGYGNIMDQFERGDMDGAFWGSFTGAMAIRKMDMQPIVRPVNPDGTSTHQGYIFAHNSSGIKKISDTKGLTIAFVDKATTAGYVFPIAYLRQQGIKNMDTYFRDYYFTGSHAAAVYAVINREAQLGCAKNTAFDQLALRDRRVSEDLVILAKSYDVPSNGLALKRKIPNGIKAAVRQALLDMDKDPEGRAVLETFGALRFIETSGDDYAAVFDIAERAGIDIKNYRYINE